MVEGKWDGNRRVEGELTPQLLISSIDLECVCISDLGGVFTLRGKRTFTVLPVPAVNGLYESIYRNLFTKSVSKCFSLPFEPQIMQLKEAINANKFGSVDRTVLGKHLDI